jgi:hypothetical protein
MISRDRLGPAYPNPTNELEPNARHIEVGGLGIGIR